MDALVLENRHTGERLAMRRVMRDGVLCLELMGSLPPRNQGPPLHIHHMEIEEGQVLAGTLGAVLDGRPIRLGPGERGRFPAGSPHRWWNDSDEVLMFEGYSYPLADLDRFLKLLARSATGQKLTAYTSIVSGPRRSGDDCGPDALHVVLLDNGRTRLMASESAEILGCIRCGACMNACPVYTSIGGHAYGDTYPGPVGAVLTPGLRGLPGWSDLPSASSLCGACRAVCPVRLDIPRMLLQLRHESASAGAPPWLRTGMRAFAWFARRPRAYRAATAVARRALRLRARDGWIGNAPGPAAAWTSVRDLRAPAATSFQQWWKARTGGAS